jgi:hypothetical protein
VFAHLFEHRVIVCRIDYDRNGFIVLCSASNHGWAADVDVLNCFRESDVLFRDRGFKRIKIDRDQVDRIKAAFTRFRFVFSVAAFVKKPAMHAGMQSFYPAIQHFRECGETRDLADRNFFAL